MGCEMVSILTDFIIEKARELLKVEPEPSNPYYSMFNTGSVEIEVGEFIYSLVRMQKPNNILETGTHKGISTLYMALALKDNKKGIVETIEFDPQWTEPTKLLWKTFEVEQYVSFNCQRSMEFVPKTNYDLILLDTEPQIRFEELLTFEKNLKGGGIIMIHDLGGGMCQVDNKELGFGWPFGKLPEDIIELVRKDSLRPFHFATPRGLTCFYRPREEDFTFYDMP